MNIKADAIANANAELNNIDAPNVYMMASVLKCLAEQAGLSGLPESNNALQKARRIIDFYSDGSAGANL